MEQLLERPLRCARVILETSLHRGREVRDVVAAVVLAFALNARRSPPPRLLTAIGEELTSRGDLTRLTLMR